MRPRKLKVCVQVAGFKLPIATLKIKKFADIKRPKTELVCPKCGNKPKWEGKYVCICCPYCGKPMEKHIVDEKGTIQYKCPEHGWQEPTTYTNWQQLKRITLDGREIKKERLVSGEEVEAQVYVMPIEKFSKYADATLTEYGVVVDDPTSALNLKKMLVAIQRLNKVIILRFNDTYEQRICLLTVSLSGRIILKEMIPINIADIKETMKVDLNNISEQDIKEAQALLSQLPEATEEIFKVTDYRTIGVEATTVSPKVIQLEQILAKVKAS